MDESSSGRDVFNELAHEFAERYRRGERPSLDEYTGRHPALAAEIRELFPALAMMEEIGGEADDHPSAPSGGRPGRHGPMPERLGDYRLLRELGRGGMGVVYEAVQESLGRHVALKVLSPDRRMGRIPLIRFRREARAAALLHHTNIVPVFFVGEQDGIHYYTMQYIQGQGLDVVLREVVRQRRDGGRTRLAARDEEEGVSATLAAGLLMRGTSAPTMRAGPGTDVPPPSDRPGDSRAAVPASPLAAGPSPDGPASPSSILGGTEAHYYRSVARLGFQATEALAHAHQHGVLHRDIKPANLLLDLEGTIWVTDFGLAKSEGSEELTSPGDVVGTVRYMAPERFRGQADARSDLYSLGLTLYEMLTLRPAFAGSQRVQLIHTILHHEPERPRKHDPHLPRDLETIVLKAIAKDPSHRFADARELASELRRFFEGRPIRSRRPSMPERIWRWSRRNPALAVLTLLATTLTSLLLIGSAAAAWKFREQRDAVLSARARTEANLDRAVMAEREGRDELGRSLLRQARALRYSGQAGRRLGALQALADAARIAREAAAPAGQVAALRDEVIAALALTDDRPVRTWSGHYTLSERSTSSIEADRYIEVEADNFLHVHRLSGGREVRVLGADRPTSRTWPVFVPGGRFVTVLSGRSRTELWDLDRGEVPAAWPADALGASPRADGRQVAVLRSDGEVHVYDLPALTESARCRVPFDRLVRFPASWMSLSEDGRYLAFMQEGSKPVLVYELATGRVVLEVKVPSARVHRGLALGRTGGLLAIVHDRAISIYDVADGERLSLLKGHQSEGIDIRFQPGGGLLASTGWDGTTRLWDPVRGHLLVTLRGAFRNWNGGGSRLEIARETDLILHQIAAGDERRTIDCRLLGDSAGAALYGPARLSYSPDGRLIAMAMRPDGVRIARAADGLGLAHLPIGECDEVLFLPSGDLLTFNARGLCRWPVRRIAGGTLRIGPAGPLAPSDQPAGPIKLGLASSLDGRLIGAAFPTHAGPMLVDPGRAWRRTWLTPHAGLIGLAISPDGRWIATAGRGESPDRHRVKVWDAATGRVLAEIPLASIPVGFSPDGRWLGVGVEDGYRLYRTASWTPGPDIDHGGEGGNIPLAFHPSSRVVAVLDTTTSKVRLIGVETGSLLATLEAPDATWSMALIFSPDGRYLAAAQSDQRVNLWDLASIRRRLEALDLASGLPDIFGGTTDSVPAVDRIEVEGAGAVGLKLLGIRQALRELAVAVRGLLDPDLDDAEELSMRGNRWAGLSQWRLAAADYRASLARRPASSWTANSLAWQIASAPGRGDAEEALGLARMAVAMEPDSPNFRNTLGVALYRAGHLAEAAAVLESNAPRNPDAGYDWVFLAICDHRLGRAARARTALDHAMRWRAASIRLSPAQVAEFREFVREAESAVNGVFPDLPAEVFAR